MRLGSCLAILLLCGGCTSIEPLPQWVNLPTDEQRDALLSGTSVPAIEVDDRPAPYDLMALSPPMRVLAQELMQHHRRQDRRAEALHRALLASPFQGGQGMRYTAHHTATAREAFQHRSVNCLSFTLMYVAMAREMGLDVRVNDVRVPPSWEWREGEPFVLFRHVNAKVMLPGGEQLVVDLEMQRYSPAYAQALIGDRLVAAQFYNNRGMELVAEGELAAGFLHLREALVLDDQQSYIWNNLGTLYNRLGETSLAELAYLQGLSLDPADLTVMSNLDSLYRQRGEWEKAAYFNRRAQAHRDNNPYYLYALAKQSLKQNDLLLAEHYLKEALRREAREPRFYELQAELAVRRNEPERAERLRREAERLQKERFL